MSASSAEQTIAECIEAALDMSANEIAELLEAIPQDWAISRFGDDGWCFDTSGDDCWWREPFAAICSEGRTPARGTSPEWDAAMRDAEKRARLAEIDDLLAVGERAA